MKRKKQGQGQKQAASVERIRHRSRRQMQNLKVKRDAAAPLLRSIKEKGTARLPRAVRLSPSFVLRAVMIAATAVLAVFCFFFRPHFPAVFAPPDVPASAPVDGDAPAPSDPSDPSDPSEPSNPSESSFDHQPSFAPLSEAVSPGDILIPHCGDIRLSLNDGVCDFSFTNPEANACYLRVGITRLDTSETVYTSPLISPGKHLSGVRFFPEFVSAGDYDAMIKVDAFSLFRLSLLGSLVFEVVIHAV